MTAKLVGYRVDKSKKTGEMFCMMNLIVPANGRDVKLVGDSVQTAFTPREQISYLKPADIGKMIELDYEYSGGNRAYLTNITVLD